VYDLGFSRMLEITRQDLEPVLAGHRGAAALRAAVDAAAEPGQLLSVVGRYVQFNSAFGPGLANLAGEIAARQGLFQDPDEALRVVADRAAEVASDFFYAAIDEFDDRLTPWRDTHRTLAQATLKAMGAYFGYTPQQLNQIIRINPATQASMARVSDGYGLGAALDDARLFRAMGFHTGSEVLADAEFNVLDQGLRARRPEMVAALQGTRVTIGGQEHDAYYWVRIHTSVEADHFDAALKGVNNAARFYAGASGPEAVKGWVLAGFAEFADVQGAFMDALAEP
jgi:hypothetical protein